MLAFHGQTQRQVAARLGLGLGEVRAEEDWRSAIDLSYDWRGSVIVVTPSLPGQDGAWVLATGAAPAINMPDVAKLSQLTGGAVQYFASHRVTETHIWAKADRGRILRFFGWSGESGEILQWTGKPDSAELEAGLPEVDSADDETNNAIFDAGVDEDAVMRIAGQWSINPDYRGHSGARRSAGRHFARLTDNFANKWSAEENVR